jgi:hypothetical protein
MLDFWNEENTFLDWLGEAIILSDWLPEANDLSLWLLEANDLWTYPYVVVQPKFLSYVTEVISFNFYLVRFQ